MREWLSRVKEDIDTVFAKDPAAKTVCEVLFCYSGLHAVHRKRARGTGSLALNAFPAQVMRALHHQPDLPYRIAIVGLPYNAYADDLDQFGGHPFTVRIVEEPLNGQLRSAAYKNKKGLGYISTETPLSPGLNTLTLTRQGQVVYATSLS